MKSVPKICALIFLGLAARNSDPKPSGSWNDDSPLAIELTKLNEKLTTAYENEDIATLRDMLAPDHVHNNVFGSVMDKETFLGDIESGTLEFVSYETPEIRWHLHSGVAIATGLIEAKAVRDGKPVPAEKFRFTRVYVNRDGKWQVLLFHNTMGKPKP